MSNTLVESEIFDIIAHPDLIRCHGIYPDYNLRGDYERLCQNAIKHNVKIEMNTSKAPGINGEFLEIAKKCGVKFSPGSDAHRPQDVGRGIKQIYNLVNFE